MRNWGWKAILLFLTIICNDASLVSAQTLKRLSFNEYEMAMAKEPKPAFIFIRTAWCSYCKRMDHSTLKNKGIINRLNKTFYFVEFDAERKSDITFWNRVYKYKATGLEIGVHELAEELGHIDGVLAYPTIVLINEELEIIYRQVGYISIRQFSALLDRIEGL